MGRYSITIESSARKDFEAIYKSGNKSDIRKVDQIFRELAVHPTFGTGKPEQLKYDKRGFWSRRINHKDRIVYKIEDTTVTVTVVPAKGHYDDK